MTLSTFSTPAELEFLLQALGIGILLFEGKVLTKDFASILADLVPEIADARPGELATPKFPYLQRLAMVGEGGGGAIEGWSDFLARGAAVAPELVQAMADAVRPADTGMLFFSSGSTGKPKGILSPHRGVAIQCWRWRRMLALEDDVRCWSANGFFWSGNFGMALGATLASGGSLILQPTFEPVEALRLMEAERATAAFAWPHQWTQLADAPNWLDVDLSSLRHVDPRTRMGAHPTVSTTWLEPFECYGNTETFTLNAAFPSGTSREIAEGSHGVPLPGNTLKIVDPLTGEIVPQGERGEIAVKVAKTVGVPHETLGGIVVACIVPNEGVELDATAIRDFVKEQLASYKAPRRILFFQEVELSLTSSAKIKSSELRQLAARRLQAAESDGP